MKHRMGFTLIELMVTIAVGGILLALAVPGFHTMIAGNRATALANEMVTALNLARSEAIKRGTPVVICRSTNGTTCNGTDWADGWMVFVDTDQNGNWDSGEEVLRAWGAMNGDPVINAGGAINIRFGAIGAPVAAVTLDIHLTGCSGNQARRLNVGPAGRISMTRQDCPS